MKQILNFINGTLVPPRSGLFLESFEPATGQPYLQVPDSGEEDITYAVEAAQEAFPSWSHTPVETRSQMLRRIANLVSEQTEVLARAESIDTGKPLSLAATVDIPRSSLNFSFFADAITQFSTECHATDTVALNYTLRQPLGVVGCISPWNLPLYLLTWKIAPALAAGNCVVAKPSEITPMTAYLLSEIVQKAGLPKGVLNIVHGLGPKAGSALCSHPAIAAISFTGSTRTGAQISQAASSKFKKLSLEMGGKNPYIVFADADLDDASTTAVKAAFSNQGQICLCGSRIYIERPIYECFKTTLIEKVRQLRLGDPLQPGTDQGAVVSEQHLEKILSYIALAQKEGGSILCGGRRAPVTGRCQDGWFIEPTLIEGLPTSCRTNQEEIFGPVATLIPFESEENVIAEANGTPYGLAASVWTQNLKRAHRVAFALQSGIVWINCWMLRDLRTPFGGVKGSGVGREGGLDALRCFTEPKNVCVKIF